MEPMKRMSLTVAIIFVIAILALGIVYMMMKKLESQVEVRSVFEESVESPPGEEVTTEPSHVTESLPESKSAAAKSTRGELPSEEAGAMESEMSQRPDTSAGCDLISDVDLSKYLKVKEAVFRVYNENKTLSDMMLDQERRWLPDQITKHMWILLEMKTKKKKALKDAEFAEKRFHYISNAMMEWIFRTNEITYEKKYVGEEDFYKKKIDPIESCKENDELFTEHKEDLLKTFMGDFELVDY